MAIDRDFFLADPEPFRFAPWRILIARMIVISGIFIVFSQDAWGQFCDCPAANICSPCSGGLTRLTLKYTGAMSTVVSAYDELGVLYPPTTMAPGDIFSFRGLIVNEKFAGDAVYLTVGADILNAQIGTICGTVYPGLVDGDFIVMTAMSKNGGTICCPPATVENEPPVISGCPNVSVNLPPSSCSMLVTWTTPTVTDNCTVASFTSVPKPGTIFQRGITPVTYTAIDSYGNQSTCTFTVTVKDITPPIIAGCSDITVPATAGCEAIVSWKPPVATDNCTQPVTITKTHTPGQVFSLGPTTVTYTATDGSGNISTCSFKVIVEDKTSPVIVCPQDIVVAANESCQATVSWPVPSVTDSCPKSPTSTHNPGDTFPIGETIVTYTATDESGNVASCAFKVIVSNDEDPDITGCPENIKVSASNDGPVTVTWEEPQASILCGELSVIKSHSPGSTFSAGTTPVTYEFQDENGNSSTCDFNVIVMEGNDIVSASKVITPDGDGINDTWIISNIENYRTNTVVVVDRWGNKIFHTNGYDNDKIFWNGTNKNGNIVPTGTYFYTIEVQNVETVVRQKGFLEVIQ